MTVMPLFKIDVEGFLANFDKSFYKLSLGEKLSKKVDSSETVFRLSSYEELGLARRPFTPAPDPAFHFNSGSHGTAIEQLLGRLSGRKGLALVFGDVGNGKTILSRRLFELVDPAIFDTCLIFNPVATESEFIAEVIQKLHFQLTSPEEPWEGLQTLRAHIKARSLQGKKTLIAVDEAQAFSDKMLHFFAQLISPVPDGDSFFLHLVLFAQQEIVKRILDPTMQSVKEAISLTCYLQPLTPDETGSYVTHRLAKAGSDGTVRFTRDAIAILHEASQGCPRVLNTLCDRSTLVLFNKQKKVVDGRLVKWVLENSWLSNNQKSGLQG
jgi:general secretion pathway protein A